MFGAGNQCPLWVLTTDPKVPWPVIMMAINSSLAKVCKDPWSMYIGNITKCWLLEEIQHSAKYRAKYFQWDFHDRYHKWFATLVFVCFVSSNSWTKLGCRNKKYMCFNVRVGLAGFASRRYHGTCTQLFTHHELSCNRSAADLSKVVAFNIMNQVVVSFSMVFHAVLTSCFFFCTSSGGFEVLRG